MVLQEFRVLDQDGCSYTWDIYFAHTFDCFAGT